MRYFFVLLLTIGAVLFVGVGQGYGTDIPDQNAAHRQDREVGLHATRKEWISRSGIVDSPLTAGWADDTVRIWLRDLPISFRPEPKERLLAVKGEAVAVQLVIVAAKKTLTQVSVTVEGFRGARGEAVSVRSTIHPVGFVHLTRPNLSGPDRVETAYKGWWPDILLDNFPFDVSCGDSQPVWISIEVPRNLDPGLFTTQVRIIPKGEAAVTMALEVEVADYELPRVWHFKNMMSFHDEWGREFYGDSWTGEMRAKFLNFLLDRRINLSSMYQGTDFSWEEISRGMERGQNTIIVYALGSEESLKGPPWVNLEVEKAMNTVLTDWTPRLKDRGWLDRSYVYGYDEVNDELFPSAMQVLPRIKRDFGVRTMSTLYDASYGLDTGLTEAVDTFVPLMNTYDGAQAAKARAAGSEVWWYEILWNIEQPLLRGRLLPWMTFQSRSDGFLIWCLNRWRGEGAPKLPRNQWKTNTKPVSNQILNDWDPWLDGVTPNSSAMYVYPGENGPLSSLRLENFRHGIEEYDLLMAALEPMQGEEQRSEGKGNSGVIEVLDICASVVRSPLDWTESPIDLRSAHEKLVRALVARKRKN